MKLVFHTDNNWDSAMQEILRLNGGHMIVANQRDPARHLWSITLQIIDEITKMKLGSRFQRAYDATIILPAEEGTEWHIAKTVKGASLRVFDVDSQQYLPTTETCDSTGGAMLRVLGKTPADRLSLSAARESLERLTFFLPPMSEPHRSQYMERKAALEARIALLEAEEEAINA